jgi:hypothetical protein
VSLTKDPALNESEDSLGCLSITFLASFLTTSLASLFATSSPVDFHRLGATQAKILPKADCVDEKGQVSFISAIILNVPPTISINLGLKPWQLAMA